MPRPYIEIFHSYWIIPNFMTGRFSVYRRGFIQSLNHTILSENKKMDASQWQSDSVLLLPESLNLMATFEGFFLKSKYKARGSSLLKQNQWSGDHSVMNNETYQVIDDDGPSYVGFVENDGEIGN